MWFASRFAAAFRRSKTSTTHGHASQLAVGALLETIVIAASAEGLACELQRRPATPDTHLLIDIHFEDAAGAAPDPLAPCIEQRVVQRRPMSPRPLSAAQKDVLNRALPAGYGVVWFESLAERARLARLMFDNARVRLNIPEAFPVHQAIIEWNARVSEDRIPSRAVGVDPITEKLMRWAMGSWPRIAFLNRWLLGDLPPRIQLDLLPGLLCAAHFALLAPAPVSSIDDYLHAGRQLQRFWLTASHLGLLVQPEMTPVIFSRYHRSGQAFTAVARWREEVGVLNGRLTQLIPGHDPAALYFLGRIGTRPLPFARSTRKPVDQLTLRSDA